MAAALPSCSPCALTHVLTPCAPSHPSWNNCQRTRMEWVSCARSAPPCSRSGIFGGLEVLGAILQGKTMCVLQRATRDSSGALRAPFRPVFRAATRLRTSHGRHVTKRFCCSSASHTLRAHAPCLHVLRFRPCAHPPACTNSLRAANAPLRANPTTPSYIYLSIHPSIYHLPTVPSYPDSTPVRLPRGSWAFARRLLLVRVPRPTMPRCPAERAWLTRPRRP